MGAPAAPGRRLPRRSRWAAAAALALAAALPASVPLEAAPPPGDATVTLVVDAGHPLRPISPLIYGVATGDASALAATHARLNRWGGNPSSRYNWELGAAWNAARDWEFRNGTYGHDTPADRLPSSAADQFLTTTFGSGAQAIVTIPALGWVARDGDNNTRSTDVPAHGGPPLAGRDGAIAGYDPTANRLVTSVPSFPRKGAPFSQAPDLQDGAVYQDEWVHHLTERFGAAATGGVRFYAVDNEPDLWAETHTDVHPVRPNSEEMLRTFLAYASAIKDVDPSARMIGPSLSGWTALFSSPRDAPTAQPLPLRGLRLLLPPPLKYLVEADRRAHGGVAFLPWWLDQVRRADQRTGRRTLDVLDVHYYPQAPGVFAGATDAGTDALRLRSTRSLWDSGYVDESWIRQTVRLIPRLREWIDADYPGTLLSIGEWNWGAEQTVNGALAIADVLGIFGREGVDVATYWSSPPPGSPGALAFRLYTDYDGRGASFGDVALRATSTVPDDVSVYASRGTQGGAIVAVVINKRPGAALQATVRLTGAGSCTSAHAFRLGPDASDPIGDVGEWPVVDAAVSLALPASSATLLAIAC